MVVLQGQRSAIVLVLTRCCFGQQLIMENGALIDWCVVTAAPSTVGVGVVFACRQRSPWVQEGNELITVRLIKKVLPSNAFLFSDF